MPLPSHFLVQDNPAIYDDGNAVCAKVFGMFMGQSLVRKFITKDYQASVQTVLNEALHGKETANFVFPLMTKSDVRLDVLLNATTRRDEQGNIIGVVVIGQDITGRLAL